MKASEHVITPLKLPHNLAGHYRAALQVHACPDCSLPNPMPVDCDNLLALLPDLEPAENAEFRADNRAWLASAPTEPEIIPKKYGCGEVVFPQPPPGLSRLEGLLFREIGRGSPRATAFLIEYYRRQRFGDAARAVGVTFDWIGLCRVASPLFARLYTSVCAAVRQGRAELIEDAMLARATGEHRALETKVIEGADGIEKRITTDGGAIYDTKAAALLLPGYKPEVFAPRTQGPGGVSISINVAVAAPAAPATVRRDAKEAVEAEVIALCPRPQPSDEVVV